MEKFHIGGDSGEKYVVNKWYENIYIYDCAYKSIKKIVKKCNFSNLDIIVLIYILLINDREIIFDDIKIRMINDTKIMIDKYKIVYFDRKKLFHEIVSCRINSIFIHMYINHKCIQNYFSCMYKIWYINSDYIKCTNDEIIHAIKYAKNNNCHKIHFKRHNEIYYYKYGDDTNDTYGYFLNSPFNIEDIYTFPQFGKNGSMNEIKKIKYTTSFYDITIITS